MQKQTTDGNITVTISRFGYEPKTVTLPANSTVSSALAEAGIVLEGREDMFVEGQNAEVNDVLEDNDILSIVTPKQAG